MRRLVISLAVALCATPAAAGELVGTVVGVSDGDTLTMLSDGRQIRVRLSGIDAPERRQAYGAVAKAHLASICYPSRAIARVVDVDRYGRAVARVRCGKVDANAEMVGAGLAWVYRRYSGDQALIRLEAEARRQQRGLWRGPSPIPPWNFRR